MDRDLSLVTFYLDHIRKNKMLQLKLERRGATEAEVEIRRESLDINANVVNKDVVSPGACFFCGQQTELLCRFCQGVYYCSQVTRRDLSAKI